MTSQHMEPQIIQHRSDSLVRKDSLFEKVLSGSMPEAAMALE